MIKFTVYHSPLCTDCQQTILLLESIQNDRSEIVKHDSSNPDGLAQCCLDHIDLFPTVIVTDEPGGDLKCTELFRWEGQVPDMETLDKILSGDLTLYDPYEVAEAETEDLDSNPELRDS